MAPCTIVYPVLTNGTYELSKEMIEYFSNKNKIVCIRATINNFNCRYLFVAVYHFATLLRCSNLRTFQYPGSSASCLTYWRSSYFFVGIKCIGVLSEDIELNSEV